MDSIFAAVSATTTRLAQWCAEQNQWVSADGRVHEATAAAILGLAPGTLRNWRSAETSPIAWHQIGGPRGRITYRLEDLARYIENSRTECHAL